MTITVIPCCIFDDMDGIRNKIVKTNRTMRLESTLCHPINQIAIAVVNAALGIVAFEKLDDRGSEGAAEVAM